MSSILGLIAVSIPLIAALVYVTALAEGRRRRLVDEKHTAMTRAWLATLGDVVVTRDAAASFKVPAVILRDARTLQLKTRATDANGSTVHRWNAVVSTDVHARRLVPFSATFDLRNADGPYAGFKSLSDVRGADAVRALLTRRTDGALAKAETNFRLDFDGERTLQIAGFSAEPRTFEWLLATICVLANELENPTR